MTGVINRPDVAFDAAAHAYKVEGEDVLGVSTVAKVGGVEDTWGIASAWGFRIGYEGAFDLLQGLHDWPFLEKDGLRAALKDAGLTPWATRDRAADRGTWVHDVFESLAEDGTVPDVTKFPEEVRGHVISLMKWFLHYRPKFVATEVQVASREHRFAGRYDIRALVDASRILPLIHPLRTDVQAERIRELAAAGKPALGLLDLKTSKGVYPTTHFPQLEGYEGASVEMGFPATDFRAVVNTNVDGSFAPDAYRVNDYGDKELGNFAISWSTYEDFIAFAEATRAVRRIKSSDPLALEEKARDATLMAQLPARSREIAEVALTGAFPELQGMDSKAIGRRLGQLAKRGKCVKGERGLWLPPEE